MTDINAINKELSSRFLENIDLCAYLNLKVNSAVLYFAEKAIDGNTKYMKIKYKFTIYQYIDKCTCAHIKSSCGIDMKSDIDLNLQL